MVRKNAAACSTVESTCIGASHLSTSTRSPREPKTDATIEGASSPSKVDEAPQFGRTSANSGVLSRFAEQAANKPPERKTAELHRWARADRHSDTACRERRLHRHLRPLSGVGRRRRGQPEAVPAAASSVRCQRARNRSKAPAGGGRDCHFHRPRPARVALRASRNEPLRTDARRRVATRRSTRNAQGLRRSRWEGRSSHRRSSRTASRHARRPATQQPSIWGDLSVRLR